MNVFHSPAGTEPPVWTEWADTPVYVLLDSLVSENESIVMMPSGSMFNLNGRKQTRNNLNMSKRVNHDS